MPDINSGEPWAEMDLADLDEFLTSGHPVESIASYLCRDVDEVAVKIERKQHADLPHPTRLLRARRERPGGRNAAQRDEPAPFHSINRLEPTATGYRATRLSTSIQ
jgi:hypothetical protein